MMEVIILLQIKKSVDWGSPLGLVYTIAMLDIACDSHRLAVQVSYDVISAKLYG